MYTNKGNASVYDKKFMLEKQYNNTKNVCISYYNTYVYVSTCVI